MNAIDLKNRTAIITGGARGIGFAIAKRMLASGATVVLWDVDAAALDEAGAALRREGQDDDGVHTAVVDVTDDAAIARAVTASMRQVGKIDILVNNAGVTGGNAPLWELAPEVWRRVVEVNLVAPYLTCRAVMPHMVRALWPHRQYCVDCRQGGQSQRLALFGVESRSDRADQIARQGIGGDRCAGQLRHARGGQDRIVRADEARAHRLHAVEDSDEPLRRGRRDCGAGGVARFGRLLVLDRRGVRYFRRPGGVLIRSYPSLRQRSVTSASGAPVTAFSFIYYLEMSVDQNGPEQNVPRTRCDGRVTTMSVRTQRYIFGSWLVDRLMAVLWAYLVLRGFGRRRGSAPK